MFSFANVFRLSACPPCECACFVFVFFSNSIFSIYLFVNWKLWQNTVKWWELQTSRRAKHTHEMLFISVRHVSTTEDTARCACVCKCATREVNLEEATLQHNHVYKQTCLSVCLRKEYKLEIHNKKKEHPMCARCT